MRSDKDKIDFVVLWVDPSDKDWQISHEKYAKKLNQTDYIDDNSERYRDWGLFKYWFRGVEQFAPWVNKIHLVTCGQVPKWLNVDHPKLNIVNHSDFMPSEALPTFNSNAIELCIHRISGLMEQFVLFNDDMFITRPVKPTDFFKDGKPVNTMSLLAITPSSSRKYCRTLVNNMEILNSHFCFKDSKRNNLSKYFSLKQGKYLMTTLPLLLYNDCPGFKNYHISVSYLKSTFEEVWKKESDVLMRTVNSRFRDYEHNVNHWLMNYWQFASGQFIQKRAGFGGNINMANPKTPALISVQRFGVVCLSEPATNGSDYSRIKTDITNSFDVILNKKGAFEK